VRAFKQKHLSLTLEAILLRGRHPCLDLPQIPAKTVPWSSAILHVKLSSLAGSNVFPYKHVVDLRTKVIPRRQSRALAIPEAVNVTTIVPISRKPLFTVFRRRSPREGVHIHGSGNQPHFRLCESINQAYPWFSPRRKAVFPFFRAESLERKS
jgi:hypothetical protein